MGRTTARLSFGLTDAGKVVLRGTCFVALAALIVPAFGVLSVLVVVMLMALLVGFVLRPKIQVSGNLPDRAIVGQTAQLKYLLKNIGRLTAYSVCVRFPPKGVPKRSAQPEAIEQVGDGGAVSQLGPGDTAEVTVTIRPKRRGCYQVKQPICQSSFPFNLFSFGTWPAQAGKRDDEQSLIVLPPFWRLQIPLRRLSRHVRANGPSLTGRTGASAEYAGNRPFVPGDSPRRIDARAWARLSMPATKEYDDDCDNYAALVLDTRASEVASSSKSSEDKELEAAISLCASVAYTIHNDCLIDCLLAGADLYEFSHEPRTVRLDKIHEILAGVEPSAGYPTEQITPALADRFYEISDVFFFVLNRHFGPKDMISWQLLELAEQAGCHSTVFLIGAPGATRAGQQNMSWTGNIQFLSADDILSGRIGRL